MITTERKMSRLIIPESEYLAIKKDMKENNEQKFIEYLNRIKLQRRNLEDSVFQLRLKNKDLENVLCRRIDDLKCWKGRILNIFGWELFETPFKRPCKKSKKL